MLFDPKKYPNVFKGHQYEIWKPILGFPGYLISSRGRVLALARKDSAGRPRTEKILKQSVVRRYFYCGVFRNGKGKLCRVHRLVALAFIPNPKRLPHVNHLDGDRFNNRVENLEWVTAKENVEHSARTGLRPKFTRSKLCKTKAGAIRKSKDSRDALALKYGVCKETISRVLRGEVWL